MTSILSARPGLRPRTSRSVLVLASVCVAALLPGTASAGADPERPVLVVEGQGGTTTTWELDRDVAMSDPRPVLSGGRTHAAVLIEAIDVPASPWTRAGGYRITAFGDGTGQAVGVLGFTDRLHPGTYRVTLLGEGPVRATYVLPDRNDPGVRIAPRTPIRTQFFGRAQPLPAGDATASVDLPRALPQGRRAIQVLLLTEPHVDEVRMCATTAADCGRRIVTPGTTDGSPQLLGQLVGPHAFPRDLRWRVSGYRLEHDRLRAAAIVF